MKFALPASMLTLSLVAGAAIVGLQARLSHGAADHVSRYQGAAESDPREGYAIDRLYIQSGQFSLPSRDG